MHLLLHAPLLSLVAAYSSLCLSHTHKHREREREREKQIKLEQTTKSAYKMDRKRGLIGKKVIYIYSQTVGGHILFLLCTDKRSHLIKVQATILEPSNFFTVSRMNSNFYFYLPIFSNTLSNRLFISFKYYFFIHYLFFF